jgi:hypothetical protein
MIPFKHGLASIALLLGAAALPCMAASSASSAASDSITTSVGSISGSIKKSSDSSSSKDDKVADGDYRIIDVAVVPEQPGTVRLKLQAVADQSADGEFFLYLPQGVVEQSRLAQGGIVTARTRPYGVEFAQGEERQAFFLVLTDEWYRELQTTPVVL